MEQLNYSDMGKIDSEGQKSANAISGNSTQVSEDNSTINFDNNEK